MTTDELEADLRTALARRAAEVPTEAADRLCGRDYRPRSRDWRAATAGMAIAATTAVTGGYLAWVFADGTNHPPTTSAKQASATIQLDGYRFALPAGFKATAAPCGQRLPGMPAPGSSRFAAGAAAHGGCVEAVLSTQADPPAASSTLTIGRHLAFVSAGQPTAAIELYVDIHSDSSYRWLVIAATDLSQRQVVTIAAKALAGAHSRR